MDFYHVPVLLEPVIKLLNVQAGGTYADCTVGGGGHSEAIIRAFGAKGRLIGLDQDPEAIRAAGRRLEFASDRITLVNTNFESLPSVLRDLNVERVDGVLMDLGVSSHQLNEGERGFSYNQDAPLDMRMDPRRPVSARDLVNEAPREELTRIIREYGEERWASRIAEFIVRARAQAPVETTGQLVDIIKAAIPAGARREGPHPAKRTFQALRIAVNDELAVLKRGLEGAFEVLAPGGRLAAISFHSLEDRIIKQTFHDWTIECRCPPDLPVCVCGGKARGRLIMRKPVTAATAELEENPRSRSAKLRVIEKV